MEEARAIHDQRAADAKTEAAGKTRSIRSDQHTLFTVVASFPTPWEELRGNDEHFSALTDWERRTVGWLKEQYGSQLVTVIRHDDERFPHIHAFVLDTGPSLRAKNLHPGHRAKTEAAANARANGANAKETNAIGDAAYKKAMRSWQDSYWSNVGLPCGLARLGPSRRRLTRSEWQTEKAAARNTAVLIQRAEQSKQAAAKVMNDAHARHQIADDREAVAIAATERAEAAIAKAKLELAEAKRVADAADTYRRKAISDARQKARVVLSRANAERAKILTAAEKRAASLRSVGGWLGSVWSGFRSVEKRLSHMADARIKAASANAATEIVKAKERLRTEAYTKMKDKLSELQGAAELAGRAKELAERRLKKIETQAKEAREAVKQVKSALLAEQRARQLAEGERERFRSLWADADNKLISMQRRPPGYRPSAR